MDDDDKTRSTDPEASTADLGKPSSATMPEKIGRYRILEQIGEGGMGIIYLAEQTEPVKRRVALKVIKLGMDTKQVIARFEAERQALAMMDHPCVARVFDAGVSDDGRSYFVMEHVPGVPITEHCDRQRLSIDQRLNLFIQVCNAVQHAHQKGIIHRDLKPTNILVSVKEGSALPKVIDFGVAKALHQKLTEKTLFTEQGQLIGTPEYMSPEQAEMTAQDIDTRSDIYSLGVLLYELLTGALPFDPKSLRHAAFGEIQRIIREVEPSKPSTKLSSLGDESTTSAEKRRLDPRSLLRELRGDLDWIVMKALEKDRDRRYETANGLAADIDRHLHNEPVNAGPPSFTYRTSKFLRRNRVLTSALASIIVVLVGATAVSMWFAWRANQEAALHRIESLARREAELDALTMRDEVQRELQRRSLINDFLLDMLRSPNPIQRMIQMNTTSSTFSVPEMLENSIERLDGQVFEGEPEIEATLRHTIGVTYQNLGIYEAATEQLRKALNLQQEVLGTKNHETLLTMCDLSISLWAQGQLIEGEALLRRTLSLQKQTWQYDDPDLQVSMLALCQVIIDKGHFDEAESILSEVLSTHVPDSSSAQLIKVTANVALIRIYLSTGRLSNVDDLMYELQTFVKAIRVNPRTISDQRSRRLLRIVFQQAWDFLASGHESMQFLDLPTGESEMIIDQLMGDFETVVRELLENFSGHMGDDHPATLRVASLLGNVLHSRGKFEEAESVLRRTMQQQNTVMGESHPHALRSAHRLAILLLDGAQLQEAEVILQNTMQSAPIVYSHDDWRIALFQSGYGKCLTMTADYDQAQKHLVAAYEGLAGTVGTEHFETRKVMEMLVELYNSWDKPDQAAEWRTKLAQPGEEETSPETERESDADKDN